MKIAADDVVKAFRGLAIAAARAKAMADEHGKENLLANLTRRQQDTVRQHLLEIKTDVQATISIMSKSSK